MRGSTSKQPQQTTTTLKNEIDLLKTKKRKIVWTHTRARSHTHTHTNIYVNTIYICIVRELYTTRYCVEAEAASVGGGGGGRWLSPGGLLTRKLFIYECVSIIFLLINIALIYSKAGLERKRA